MENNTIPEKPQNNSFKFALATTMAIIGLILLFSKKKKEKPSDTLNSINKDQPIIINNYVNELKKDDNNGKSKPTKQPKTEPKKSDFIDITPGVNTKPDDSGLSGE